MCYSWRKTWSQQGTRATPVEKLGKTRQGGHIMKTMFYEQTETKISLKNGSN